MSKVTDLLLDSLRKAEAGDQADLDANLEKLSARHLECCCGLLPEEKQHEAIAGVERLIAEFARIAKGVMMLGERPPRSVDEAVAVGERLSAYLMALHMESEGMPAVAVNAAEVIATDAVFGNATPLDGTRLARAPPRCCSPCSISARFRWSPDSTARRWTAVRRRSDAAARIFRHRFWPPRWTHRSYGSGPMSTASCPAIRAWSPTLGCFPRSLMRKRPSWHTTEPRCCIPARSRRWSSAGSRCGAKTVSLRRSRARASCPLLTQGTARTPSLR